ncbi:MAG TPA: hypothetical protein VJ577_17980 [Burkholderiaceae bacterium]|nr:hypothetical protein [Burkholderiaceae bacterium]
MELTGHFYSLRWLRQAYINQMPLYICPARADVFTQATQVGCLIASNFDPEFALNSDPLFDVVN